MAKHTFTVRPQGNAWAAVSPEGEELATFPSHPEAQQYAATYAEVFNILAAHTGQTIRFGTGKGESPREKEARIKQQADDAARQFMRAGENAANPQFATPADAPRGEQGTGHRAQARAPSVAARSSPVAAQAAAPAPQLAGEAEGLSEADVRRILKQEHDQAQAKNGGGAKRGRRSVAAAAQVQTGASPPQPRSRKSRRGRRSSSQRGAGYAPGTVGGGFVLEDPSVSLTAFDISQQLAGGTPAAAAPVMTSTTGYAQSSAGAMTAAVPAPGPVAAAAGATPPVGVPALVGLPSNAPANTSSKSGGAGGSRSRPQKPGKAILTPADKRSDGKHAGPVAVEVKNTRELAKTIDWAALNAAGKQGLEKARDDNRWMAGLKQLVQQREQATAEERRKKKERADLEERHQTRTSRRLLDKSHQQLAKVFKPFGNALENFKNTTRSMREQAYANLAKKLGIDRLGKYLERESRGFAANAARGGSRRAFSMAARRFGQGSFGQAGAQLGGQAVGAAAGRYAGAAAKTGAATEAAEAGTLAAAGLALDSTVVGIVVGTTLIAGALALAAKAALDFTLNIGRASREMLESQRDMARLNAGIAMSFAQLDFATFRRDVQRAGQTSASIDLLSQSQRRLQNNTAGFGTAAKTLENVFHSTLNNALSAFMERSGLSQFGRLAAIVTDFYAQWRGGRPGPKGHPALKFLDEVAQGKFRSPAKPKNQAPKKPGQP